MLLSGHLASCSADHTVKIWSSLNWKQIALYTGHKGPVNTIENIDSDRVASGSFDETIHIWAISDSQTKYILKSNSPVNCLLMMNNGYLVSGDDAGKIKIWNLTQRSVVRILSNPTLYVQDLVFVNEGVFVSATRETNIIVWNLTTSSPIYIFEGNYPLKVVSPTLLASYYLRKVAFWNLTTGNLSHTSDKFFDEKAHSFDTVRDGVLISGGSFETQVNYWSIHTGLFLGHTETYSIISALLAIGNCKLFLLFKEHSSTLHSNSYLKIKILIIN